MVNPQRIDAVDRPSVDPRPNLAIDRQHRFFGAKNVFLVIVLAVQILLPVLFLSEAADQIPTPKLFQRGAGALDSDARLLQCCR